MNVKQKGNVYFSSEEEEEKHDGNKVTELKVRQNGIKRKLLEIPSEFTNVNHFIYILSDKRDAFLFKILINQWEPKLHNIFVFRLTRLILRHYFLLNLRLFWLIFFFFFDFKSNFYVIAEISNQIAVSCHPLRKSLLCITFLVSYISFLSFRSDFI